MVRLHPDPPIMSVEHFHSQPEQEGFLSKAKKKAIEYAIVIGSVAILLAIL